MNQELMTLDFWQDTVIYEGKTFPIGTLACDALNVPADTISKMNEQCEKINLMLGAMNAKQDASALFPMVREAALAMLDILSKNAAILLYGCSKTQRTDRKGLYYGLCVEPFRVCPKSEQRHNAA